MENVHELLQILVRRFGLLNADCCESCCGEAVSPVQSHILFEIKRQRSASMQQVAEELGMDITTFSRQIKTLEQKGLVRKTADEEDRRVNLLSLTSAGEQAAVQIERHMTGYLERLFANFTEFEREAVVRSIRLLNEALLKSGSCCQLK